MCVSGRLFTFTERMGNSSTLVGRTGKTSMVDFTKNYNTSQVTAGKQDQIKGADVVVVKLR